MNETSLIIDLHCHTTASDGQLTPTEIIHRAHGNDIDVLAVTDHDTTAGLAEAHQANNSFDKPLTLIDGVEVSAKWHSFDIHIVGLGIDRHNPGFQDFLTEQRLRRDTRALAIGEKLEKAGIEGAYEGAKALANGAAISRGHFARYMVNQGYFTAMAGVFKKYLVKGKTGYVANNWHSIEETVKQIHNAGGVAIIAHPSRYNMSTKWLRKLINEFKSCGGDGIETVLSQQGVDERALLISFCHVYDLYASLGSDFHFDSPWVDLGRNMHQPSDCPWIWQSPKWQEKIAI
ncbi:PHP domain-containing protein [Paraferrimonas sp. SM1919]|uniref:RNase RNM n=1 Tax=Paraferrimonas sp. SM1919 TaxID=2662263 RepID=UPI0013D85D22|nr:PHP domain-containing protein [Paraferrimonas sp. SM1919]